eukprot:TRINITY_DN84163_c0_g1_i1.p1 TRINITY_DN84163_c0_g1~~TRINITY_DN84163_c0_g1_i1.p1  ORF type:complete len:351 (-),score=44.26 TRINITY_DN84163_c0_g1_i1:58-1083(-)
MWRLLTGTPSAGLCCRCRLAYRGIRHAGTAAKPAQPAEDETMRVILTFSGKVRASDGSEIWSRVAKVMRTAGANIETCGGTFVQMQQSSRQEQDEDIHVQESFSVSAFGACISPAALPEAGTDEEPRLGCTMFVKAVLPAMRVAKLMRLLQTQSPLQVYTASLSSKTSSSWQTPCAATGLPHLETNRQTGSLHLFGVDRPGQLARITEILTRYGVGVSNLRVQNGIIAPDSCDFVPTASKAPLAENRIRIVFDANLLDLDRLRREIQRVGEEVGYAVTCLTVDAQSQFRAFMPSYLLRRRAFALAYLMQARASKAARRCLKRPLPRRSRRIHAAPEPGCLD